MAARFRLDDRLFAQDFDGFIIDYVAVDNQTVMSVTVKGIKGRVADDADIWMGSLNLFNGPANQVIRIVSFAGFRCFVLRINLRKDSECRHPQFNRFPDHIRQEIDRPSVHTRHGGNRIFPSVSFTDEKGKDEISRRQNVLCHHTTVPLIVAIAAKACSRKFSKYFQ